MKKETNNQQKILALFTLTIFVISSFLMAIDIPVKAQVEYENQYINGGSVPLPAGVTPDITLDTYAHLSFRPTTIGLNQIF